MEFKERIKELRIEKNLSQTALAAMFDKSESAVRMWEVGKSKPDADTLIELSKVFSCSVDYLLGLSTFTDNNEKITHDENVESFLSALSSLDSDMREYISNQIGLIIFFANAKSDLSRENWSRYMKIISGINQLIGLYLAHKGGQTEEYKDKDNFVMTTLIGSTSINSALNDLVSGLTSMNAFECLTFLDKFNRQAYEKQATNNTQKKDGD